LLLPPLTRVRQRFDAAKLEDPTGELRRQLAASGVTLRAGQHLAIAVGSRGIANYQSLVTETVRWVRAQGAEPFIVPAMGSHGGATAEGQRAILEDYGITEANVGAPIRSSMEVVELPRGDLPAPVYWDRNAYGADAVIVINRVKPHTDFHGPYESGLMKMLAVGLGKQQGAAALHHLGVPGLRDVAPRAARAILARGKVLLGVAIVENAYDQTCLVRVLRAEEIPEREPELLEEARRRMPSLPVRDVDILIVDRIGKDISGTCLDPNIIGRILIRGEPEPDYPRVKMLVAREMTEGSHGNALGVGLADIITRRLFDRIDLRTTYANLFTAGFLERGKIPIITENDRRAIEFAFRGCGPVEPPAARIIRIRDTLHLDELHVSPEVLSELEDSARIEVLGPVGEPFDGEGNLRPFEWLAGR
jgi:hypothetical protein